MGEGVSHLETDIWESSCTRGALKMGRHPPHPGAEAVERRKDQGLCPGTRLLLRRQEEVGAAQEAKG